MLRKEKDERVLTSFILKAGYFIPRNVVLPALRQKNPRMRYLQVWCKIKPHFSKIVSFRADEMQGQEGRMDEQLPCTSFIKVVDATCKAPL